MSLGDVIQSTNHASRPSQGDFMMEEAAISHLMHRADNMPKIQFKLESDQNEKSDSQGTFGVYNTVSKTTFQDQHNRKNNPGAKSLSCVGIQPKILGAAYDLAEMSPIGKYLRNENQTHDLLLSDTPLDFIAPYPHNPAVNNLVNHHNSNISIVSHGANF